MTNSLTENASINSEELDSIRVIEDLKNDTISKITRVIDYKEFIGKQSSLIRSAIDFITGNKINPDELTDVLFECRRQYKETELRKIKDDDKKNDLDLAA